MSTPNITSYGDLRAAEKTGTRDTVVTSNLGFLIALRGNADARDRLAEAAMQGILGGRWPDSNDRAEIARRAYAMADAMLNEREV